MDSRQKFKAVMDFDTESPIPKVEFAYWAGAIRKWIAGGLPELKKLPEEILDSEAISGGKPVSAAYDKKTDINVMTFLQLDSYLSKFPFDLSPQFKPEIIEDHKDYKIYRDDFGLIQKALKTKSGIPMVLDYPIKNRKDFYNYISHYGQDFSKRLPDNFDQLAFELKTRDFPIRLGGNPFGFSFLARHLMGEVKYMISLYDDPALIKEFNAFFLQFLMNYWAIILEKIEIDCIFILEDVAYRSGSFISGEMFREFLRPYYLEFIDYLKQFRINNIFVDCDGLVNELIPLWIETGVTGIFPLEAVNDLEQIRECYPRLKLLGGFNKKLLFTSSTIDSIDIELQKIKRMVKKGGYIPHIDHAVSEDVTWEKFKYYRLNLNNICDHKK